MSGATAAPETFKRETQQPQVVPQTLRRPIQPIPDPSATRYTPPMPRLITPENREGIRATMRQVRPTVHYQTISRTPRPAARYRAPSDGGGWRASSD